MKTIAVAILFIMFIHQITLAQDTIAYSPNYNYKIGFRGLSERCFNDLVQEGTPVWSGGIQAMHRFGRSKSFLESGLYYITRSRPSVAEYYSRFNSIYYGAFFNMYYHYLSIPLNYRIETKSIYFSTGFNLDFLLNHSKEYNYPDEEILYFGDDRKFMVGFNMNLGIEKQVSSTLSLFAEARLTYTFSSQKNYDGGLFMSQGNIGYSYSTYGVGFGINYKFLN